MVISRIFCCFLLILGFTSTAQAEKSIHLDFYSEKLEFDYHESIVYNQRITLTERAFQAYYQQMNSRKYAGFLNQLLSTKEQLNLNGYLFYELLYQTIEIICKDKSRNIKTLTTWFLLAKSGYDVRLTHLGRSIYLYGYVTDNIYNTPIINVNNKEYVNLSDLKNPYKSNIKGSFFLVEFTPNQYGDSFSFSLRSLPKLKSQLHTRNISFENNGQAYNLPVKIDKTIVDIMRDYPLVDERYYLQTPLSRGTYDSLIPKLKKILEGKTELQAVELLLGLTRSSFKYKTDTEHFGRNKPMIPDEVLYYSYSDCEDRSALFYYLVKELLGLPMIIVDYPDHLTVGIDLNENIGKPLRYKGRRYTICDPTGPDNSCRVGIYPSGYERKPYKIALSFK